ncbi:flagellar type III secretion system pore protein FliP [Ligilactobacillus sp. WILCCON 0076]|uniref:Flagellar biosynthetic protein FliP n=1 Tax=Ligilactobacillus ubinensis TaxID=2876789 RepID=A0A9X2FHS6_9LACO|nr:flagellar type III secretion system pore protein FliP [Ligilactobacillus ubinensis]MCP0886241.1 flagellar type III secretion system pore protein FliP [Ligilactobacillus ubinensis]
MKISTKRKKELFLVGSGCLLGLLLIAVFPTYVRATTTSDISSGINKLLGGTSDTNTTINTFILLTVLSFIPILLIMTTSFTRIVMVLSFTRSALGTQNNPPNQVLLGLALFLTFFTMKPTYTTIYNNAYQPYTESKITQTQAINRSEDALKKFMYKQTRTKDLKLFLTISKDKHKYKNYKQLPISTVIPAFIISEMKTAFSIGFLIYIPFLIIDMVVSSILMSMGMMMLSPVMISLPFKLLLFVLVDGWYLLVQSLVAGFK